VRELVTTNYDPLVELAAADIGRPLRVLPFQEAVPGAPWLLKLHGDAAHPDSIVLTREQYLEFGDHRSALAGVLQSLLLTRHVLFVGTSMLDDDLIRIAHQVRSALQVPGEEHRRRTGTVLALREDPVRARLWERDVETVAMAPTTASPPTTSPGSPRRRRNTSSAPAAPPPAAVPAAPPAAPAPVMTAYLHLPFFSIPIPINPPAPPPPAPAEPDP